MFSVHIVSHGVRASKSKRPYIIYFLSKECVHCNISDKQEGKYENIQIKMHSRRNPLYYNPCDPQKAGDGGLK
jgi:hypothetical protein